MLLMPANNIEILFLQPIGGFYDQVVNFTKIGDPQTQPLRRQLQRT